MLYFIIVLLSNVSRYMSSRLFITLNLIYIPLYIDERASLDTTQEETIRQTIASVPLVCYLASFFTSILLKLRTNRCNDKVKKSIK